MNQNEQTYVYVSVKEFAAMAHITPQAIYNRINDPSVLKFVKIKKGRKFISTAALDLFSIKTVDKPIKNDMQSSVSLLSDVSRALDILTPQLAVKDAQIAAKDLQISELNQRLKEANQLYQNNQLSLGIKDKKRK